MTYKQVASKMQHHAALAYDAWNNGNLFDYLIEHAQFEMARKELAKRDRQAAALYAAVEMQP
jgi:hypothetical protein